MVAGKIGAVADRKVRMASKTAGAADKLNGGSVKMEDVAEKTEGAAKKLKTIGKEDGGCGGEDGECLRQICANVAGRRDKGCATFCASGRCANGLKINCLEWQKTRRWPPFLPKNAAKMKKKGQKG